jgi:hypothetical protein
VEIDKITKIATKDDDGFFAMYFDRKGDQFTGASCGMSEQDAVHIINEIINKFSLDRAKLADFIAPAIILKLKPEVAGNQPFGNKPTPS